MMIDRASPNCDARPAGGRVDMLVLHYTGMQSADAALSRLTDPAAEVSAHYMIDEDGTLVRLVPEGLRAWHAGASYWRGATDINARSIGIELVNPGHEFGYRAFPDVQVRTLIALCRSVLQRHAIPAYNVVGHSDVAPRRKMDPGELFDWRRLAGSGIGLWPGEAAADEADVGAIVAALGEIGYETTDLSATLTAFQRRFRQHRIDGCLDQQTARLVAGLADAMRRGPK